MQGIGPNQDLALNVKPKDQPLRFIPLIPFIPVKKGSQGLAQSAFIRFDQRPIGYRLKALWDTFRFSRFSQILTAAKYKGFGYMYKCINVEPDPGDNAGHDSAKVIP